MIGGIDVFCRYGQTPGQLAECFLLILFTAYLRAKGRLSIAAES